MSVSETSPCRKGCDTLRQDIQQFVSRTSTFVMKAGVDSIQQTGDFVQTHWPKVTETCKKTAQFSIKILKIGIAFGLFCSNTTFFMLGAAAAVVFPDHMNAAMKRIERVWESLPKQGRFLIFAPLPLAWPSYFVIAAPLVGAKVSLLLQERAGRVCQQSNTPPPSPSQQGNSSTLKTTSS